MTNLLKKRIGGATIGESRSAGENAVNNISGPSSSNKMNNANRVLSFHSVHGDKIRLSKQGRLAKRYDSFCQGLTFSNRPIELDEIVVIKIAETSTRYCGVLRFGVTGLDPQTLAINVPKYACPDMSEKGTTWAKGLTERFCQQGNIVNFYVRPNGEMYYGVNGVQKGQYLTNINVSLPLWVVVDIYGNTTAIEFLDPSEVPLMRHNVKPILDCTNNSGSSVISVGNLAPIIRPLPSTMPTNDLNSDDSPRRVLPTTPQPIISSLANDLAPTRPRNPEEQRILATAQCALELNQRLGRGAASAQSSLPSRAPYPPLKFNNGCEIHTLEFHEICGKNVRISNDKCVATRNEAEYANGYTFIKKPLKINEKIVVQLLKLVPQYTGSLAFGVTTCDPLRLAPALFPDDSDCLMDRSEYWVVAKDVVTNPQELDEITFYVNDQGEVHFQRNNLPSRIIVHVDNTQKLWLFFDVFGTTQQIRLVGSTTVKRTVTSIIPMTGSETRQIDVHLAPSSSAPVLPRNNDQLIPTQTFHNQNFVQQQQSQQLHVQLPPPQNVSQQQNVSRQLNTNVYSSWSGQPPSPQPSPPIPPQVSQMPSNLVPSRRRRIPNPPNNPANLSHQQIPPPPARYNRPPTSYQNQSSCPRPSVPQQHYQAPPPPQVQYFQPPYFHHQQQVNAQQPQFAQQATNFPTQFQQNHRRSSPYFGPVHQVFNHGNNGRPVHFPVESRMSPVQANEFDTSLRPPASPTPGGFPRALSLSDHFNNLTLSGSQSQTQATMLTRPIELDPGQATTSAPATAPPSPRPPAPEAANVASRSSTSREEEMHDECVVCMNEIPNCVLYTCGHLCMCYTCAQATWQQQGVCPICRQTIKDVIKLYKSVA